MIEKVNPSHPDKVADRIAGDGYQLNLIRVPQDPDYITLETIFNEYMSEDDRKDLGIE